MSFSKLPEEIVDAICEQVYGFKGGVATETLRHLSLTSRQTLSPSRRWLYRAPFRAQNLYKSRPRLSSLIRTLTKHSELARQVRGLHLLHKAVQRMQLNWEDPAGLGSGDLTAATLQDNLLSLCPRLLHFSLSLRNKKHAKRIAAEAATRPDLKRVDLALGGSEYHPVFSAWLNSYKPEKPLQPAHVTLLLTDCVHESNAAILPGLPSMTIDLCTSSACPSSAISFLPKDISSVDRLSILSRGWHSELSLPELFMALSGNSLTRFDFSSLPLPPVDLQSVSEYPPEGDPHFTATLPSTAFSSFPHATHLSLLNQRNMSLDKLSLLADTSPSLIKLDLSGSYWTFTASSFTRRSPSTDSSAGEEQLIDVLRRFDKLKTVKLGILPFNQHVERLSGLEEYCRGRGLKLEVEGCMAMDWKPVEPREEHQG